MPFILMVHSELTDVSDFLSLVSMLLLSAVNNSSSDSSDVKIN